jgi:hypothetical protein
VLSHKGWVAAYANSSSIELALEKLLDCWKKDGGLMATNTSGISPHNAVQTILQALEQTKVRPVKYRFK